MEKGTHLPYRLFKRGDIWHAYYSFKKPSGKRIQFRETTGRSCRDEAERYVIERIHKLQQSTNEAGRLELTLDESFARYFEEKGQYQTRPEMTLGRLDHLKNILDVKYLSQIDETIINKFITTERGRISNSTINRYLCLLSVVINTARDEWRAATYYLNIGKFKLKEPAENVKYLKDWDTAQRIIDNAHPHIKPIIYTALFTGLRLGNILNLKWQDIDLKNRMITVKVKDKGKLGGKVHTVPIIDNLYNLLINIPQVSDYVFTWRGKRMKTIWSAWRNIFYKRDSQKNFTKELKDPTLPYINFHTLRHTAATWILKSTGDLRATKEVLGHSDIKTTLKYAHILDNTKRKALDTTFLAQNLHIKLNK